MTTIAVDVRHGQIAADTRVTWEGIGTDVFSGVKLFPAKNGAVYGATGENCTGSIRAVEWLQGDRLPELKPLPPEYEHDWDWKLVELSPAGIALYNMYMERELCLDTVLAVGSGRKVAMYCMRYLRMSPAEAVHEACKVDHFSDAPIYVASVKDPRVVRWSPPRRKKKAHTPATGAA